MAIISHPENYALQYRQVMAIVFVVVICVIGVSYLYGKFEYIYTNQSSVRFISNHGALQNSHVITAEESSRPINKKLPVIDERISIEMLEAVIQNNQSMALVSLNKGSAFIVGVGDILPTGLVVVEVNSDQLLLRRIQEFERVLLRPKHDVNVGGGVDAESTIALEADKLKEKAVHRVGNENLGLSEPPEGIDKISENQYLIRRDYIIEQFNSVGFYRQALIESNKGEGFLFKVIQPGSVFDHLGFRIGDIIYEANGISIKTIRDVMSVRDDFNNVSEMNITVIRNKMPKSLYYYLD